MENYEQKYNDAIEQIRKAFAPVGGCKVSALSRKCLEIIFPELAESKDEKVRKVIVGCCIDHGHKYGCFGVTMEDMCAWLEKQKEENKGNDGKISHNIYMDKEEFKKLVESNIINTSITWHDTIDQLWELYRKRLDPDTVVEWLYEQINSGSMQVDNISKTETTFKKDFGL